MDEESRTIKRSFTRESITVIVMATLLEAKPFILGLGLKACEQKPFEIFKGDQEGKKGHVLLVVSRIGKANAAMATALCCQKYKPAYLFNLGSAGATHPGLSLGEIVHINKIIEYDRPDFKSGTPHVFKPDKLDGFKTACLATSDRAVIDPGERKKVSLEADLTDMEGASVFQACRLFQARCFFFKFVSDRPEHTSGKDIVKNIKTYRTSFYEFFRDQIWV